MGRRGRKPIDEATKARIRDRLAAGQSQQRIAHELGLSRGTVWNVTHDRHCKQPSESAAVLNPGEIAVVPTRCANGHLVLVRPCRECLAEVYKAVDRRNALAELERESERRARGLRPVEARGARELTLRIELAPAEQQRLEEVRRAGTPAHQHHATDRHHAAHDRDREARSGDARL
jgi:hypothetical protein